MDKRSKPECISKKKRREVTSRGKPRCVLVGGSGFLGMNIAKKLHTSGYGVCIIDVRPMAPGYDKWFDYHCLDYRDSAGLARVLKKGDILFHFAYTTLPVSPAANMDEDVRENVFESVRLFKLAVQNKISRLVFPSSGGTVYGECSKLPINEDAPTDPICSYGITKLMIEKYLILFNRLYGMDYLILRIGNPYGPGQRTSGEQGLIVSALIKALRRESLTVFGSEDMVRDYIYIDDVVDAIAGSLESKIPNGVYNIGTGIGYSIRQIVDMVSRITGVKLNTASAPKRFSDVSSNVLDSTKLRKALSWKPGVPIETGMRLTLEWLENNGIVSRKAR